MFEQILWHYWVWTEFGQLWVKNVCMYVLTDPTTLPSGSQSLWQHRPHNCCYIYIFLTDQWGGGLLNTLWQSSANVILRYMKHINSITQSELLYKHTTHHQPEPWPCFPETKWSKHGVMCASDKHSVFLTFSLLQWIVLVAVRAENLALHKCVDQNGKNVFSAILQVLGILPLL